MILIAEEVEDFLHPNEPPYDVITKQQISSIDPDRNLHAKIFLFGKQTAPGQYILRSLIGSSNATIPGFCKNIEFWMSSEGYLNLSQTPEQSLLGLLKNERIDPTLFPLVELCKQDDSGFVLAPMLDLIWRLIRNARGLDAGLEPRRSQCLSDALMQQKELHFREIFVHTLGDNSLWQALKTMIESTLNRSSKESLLEIVSPYHDWKGLNDLFSVCKRALKRYDQTVRIKLLTTFPPHFPNMYLSKEPFEDLDKMSLGDKRLKFEYRFWTRSSEIEVSKLLEDESLQNISSVFLHGKVLIASNDKGNCEVLLGSPNATGAAITPSPKVNLECGVWERDVANAKNIQEAVMILWNSGRIPNSSLREQLEEWRKTRDETPIFWRMWSESSDVIRESIQATFIKDNTPSSDRTVYLDQLPSSYIDIRIGEGSPRINTEGLSCVCLPDLDVQRRYELQASKINEDLFRIKLDIPNIQPCRLFYKILVPTKLIREVSVEFEKYGIDRVVIDAPTFLKEPYEIRVLVKTKEGLREYDNIVAREGKIICGPVPSPVLGKYVKLRFYSIDTQSKVSLGWNSLAIHKRRPNVCVQKSCACRSALCVELKETPSPLASKLIPDSVTVDFKTDMPEPIVHVVKKITHDPYHVQHYFGFAGENPFATGDAKVNLELFFRDEHSSLRHKEDLYTDVSCEPTISKSECNLDKVIRKILDSSNRLQVASLPSAKQIVDQAPLSFFIRFPDEVVDLLSEVAASVIMDWHLLHWGKIWQASPVSTRISIPAVSLEIEPGQLASALQTDVNSLSFEGTFKATISVELKTGWRIQVGQVVLEIKKTTDYIRGIFSGEKLLSAIEKYVQNKKALAQWLINAVYDVVSKRHPHLAMSLNDFIELFNFGFFGAPGTIGLSRTLYQGFRIPKEEAIKLVSDLAKRVSVEIASSFFSDPNQPKMSVDIFLKELSEMVKSKLKLACEPFNGDIVVIPNLIILSLGLSI